MKIIFKLLLPFNEKLVVTKDSSKLYFRYITEIHLAQKTYQQKKYRYVYTEVSEKRIQVKN